ncbi:hypothetical protein NHH73_27545 [Oxalobacteraceae bacterium OTU3CINTB1]|nr:hypothetical protein NHH73_27545 [Oxalobacteraceae bacterium OTU3CINTB1]
MTSLASMSRLVFPIGRPTSTRVLFQLVEQRFGKADVVGAVAIGHAETDVPVLLNPRRVDDDELVAVGGAVHLRVQHLFCHGHAAAVEAEHHRKGLALRGVIGRRRVDQVAALFLLVGKRFHLRDSGLRSAGQDQQTDKDFHGAYPEEVEEYAA